MKYNLDISFVILRLVEQENISRPKNKSLKTIYCIPPLNLKNLKFSHCIRNPQHAPSRCSSHGPVYCLPCVSVCPGIIRIWSLSTECLRAAKQHRVVLTFPAGAVMLHCLSSSPTIKRSLEIAGVPSGLWVRLRGQRSEYTAKSNLGKSSTSHRNMRSYVKG